MGKSEDNVLTHGLRGKIGDLLVFRIVNGKTIVGKTPSTANRTATEKQLAQQDHFQEAVIYGKSVMVTPELKTMYETSIPVGRSVYQVALADFLNAPKIKQVDIDKYDGKPGSTIVIRAVDDFKVKSVTVLINNADGNVVEEGEAALAPNGIDWIFTATVSNASISGDKIVIRASDIPGNITKSEVNL